MSSNYPPQGAGQPNQPQPSYGPPPGYRPPGQPPQYGQGQPGQNYNQPPIAPTQSQGYGAPPAGGYYGPPPGPNPYGTPQGAPPYGYPAQVKPKAKSNKVGLIIAGVIVLFVVVAGVLGALGILSNVDAADYPGSTKATLTDKGTSFVNNLYDNKKSDNDNRKVFLTADTPDAVFKYYRDDLTKKGWTFDEAGTLSQVAANKFSKGSKLIYVIAGAGSQGIVKDAGSQNFIILLTGEKT